MGFTETFITLVIFVAIVCGIFVILQVAYLSNRGVQESVQDLWETFFGGNGNDLPAAKDLISDDAPPLDSTHDPDPQDPKTS